MSREAKITIITIVGLVAVSSLAVYILLVRPAMQLSEVAAVMCSKIEASGVERAGLYFEHAGPTLEEIGATPKELNEEMQKQCKSTMQAVARYEFRLTD